MTERDGRAHTLREPAALRGPRIHPPGVWLTPHAGVFRAPPDRAVLFIDGNDWYHALRKIGLDDLGRLDYAAVSRKLVGPRTWVATRYYVGQVLQQHGAKLYADQRRFLSSLQATDRRISYHLGRLETRPARNEAAEELLRYLQHVPKRIDTQVFHDLLALAHRHRKTTVIVEKAVDVMLAVDLVVMAERDDYDAEYLLSADGDFTPAVTAAKKMGKRVFVATPAPGAQLAAVADAFIRLKRDGSTTASAPEVLRSAWQHLASARLCVRSSVCPIVRALVRPTTCSSALPA